MSKAILTLINKLHFVSSKMHMFHWNVHGKDFLSYHAFFEEAYKELLEQKDALAEYLRVSKVKIVIDFNEVANHAKTFNIPAKADDMLTEALHDYKSLLKDYESIKPDAVLEAIISEILPEINKKIYMMQSILM